MNDSRITRRDWLRRALWASAAVGTAGALTYAYRVRDMLRASPSLAWDELHEKCLRLVCDRLPRERALAVYFHYLNIAPEVFHRYVDDYNRAEAAHKLTSLHVDIYGRFLLSTDFFVHPGDESRSLAYVAFYDPRLTPCYNPLRSA